MQPYGKLTIWNAECFYLDYEESINCFVVLLLGLCTTFNIWSLCLVDNDEHMLDKNNDEHMLNKDNDEHMSDKNTECVDFV